MIGRLLRGVKKLKGRSSHELYSRFSQRAYAWRERAALQFGGDNSPEPSVQRDTFARPFFAGIQDAGKTVAALRSSLPDDEVSCLARAASIERGEIPLLGYGFVNIGQTPEWQRDPFAKLSAPLRHWSTIPYLDPAIVGDHKVVWEISRHQYFVTLGQAWQYSRDERWPTAFRRYLESWLNDNPATVGMNWASSLEVSYRAISWIWAMQLMRDSAVVDDALQSRTLKSLRAHGRHLERYLSTYFSPNTHLTGEALGLFYIGTQCPELPEAARWREIGASVLEATLSQQVLPDGVYFEQATQYHRYTIDIYLHYLLLARANKTPVSPVVQQSLKRLFDVLLYITRGDGSYPLIGDDDGGRLVQLDDRKPHDARSLLATGAVVFKRSDLAWVGRGDDAAMCWMLGADSVLARDALVGKPPTFSARAFDEGGLYVIREGWNADDGHLVFDAGPHGALSYGHSHADALSIDLSVGGRPLFVDAGTYTYVGAERNAFRTTSAHNTVEIDGVSTSTPGSAFRWNSVAHARSTAFVDQPEFSCVVGTHDGYATSSPPLSHERCVFQPEAGLWVVRDFLQTSGAHDAVLRWRCAPGIAVDSSMLGSGISAAELSDGEGARAELVILGGSRGKFGVEGGWVSEQFGHKSPTSVCAWRERTNGNACMASIVIDSARHEISWDATTRLSREVSGAFGVLAVRSKHRPATELTLIVVGNDDIMRISDLQVVADVASFTMDATTNRVTSMTAVGVKALYRRTGNTITFTYNEPRWVVIPDLTTSVGATRVRSSVMYASLQFAQGSHQSAVLSHSHA